MRSQQNTTRLVHVLDARDVDGGGDGCLIYGHDGRREREEDVGRVYIRDDAGMRRTRRNRKPRELRASEDSIFKTDRTTEFVLSGFAD